MKKKNEFVQLLCSIYIVFVFSILPLYNKGTYYMLGDDKYLLFRNVTILCLATFGLVSMVGFFVLTFSGKGKRGSRRLSIVDVCMLLYAGCTILSTLCSQYPETAIWGYQDWYMGGISQLLFVGVYFMISWGVVDHRVSIWSGVCGLFGVVLIGLLQRLEIDPLRLHVGFSKMDWEYSHLLSTVGNINWLCGYLSVSVAMVVGTYLQHSEGLQKKKLANEVDSQNLWSPKLVKGDNLRKFPRLPRETSFRLFQEPSYNKKPRTPLWADTVKGIVFYSLSVLGLALLCIQGSDLGWVLAVSCIALCVLVNLRNKEQLRKVLLLTAGGALFLPFFAWLVRLRESQNTMPVDGNVLARIDWQGWWFIGGALLVLYAITRISLMNKTLVGVALIGGILCILHLLHIGAQVFSGGISQTIEQLGAEGRGALFRYAWSGFVEASPLQKIVGVGPDCFAEYIYGLFGENLQIHTSGRWVNAVFANAHNEWINHLVNMGVIGVVSYGAIFVSALRRYRKIYFGLLAIVMYMLCMLVNFQQVMSTPLLFLVLGLCENQVVHKFETKFQTTY